MARISSYDFFERDPKRPLTRPSPHEYHKSVITSDTEATLTDYPGLTREYHYSDYEHYDLLYVRWFFNILV